MTDSNTIATNVNLVFKIVSFSTVVIVARDYLRVKSESLAARLPLKTVSMIAGLSHLKLGVHLNVSLAPIGVR